VPLDGEDRDRVGVFELVAGAVHRDAEAVVVDRGGERVDDPVSSPGFGKEPANRFVTVSRSS
jgi:hypothetical protein